MEILCFFAGIAFVHTKAIYALVFLGASLLVYPRRLSILCSFLVAIFWGLIHQYLVTDYSLPSTPIIPKATIIGSIDSIPSVSGSKSQFYFKLQRLNDQAADARVLLSCYISCPNFKVGEVWQFQVKLKKPVKLGNPGSFDYPNYLAARHINWTGYLNPKNSLLLSRAPNSQLCLRLRALLAATITMLLPHPSSLGIVEALTIGLTNHIDKAQWALFRRTGTTHLMVISGAHIGLVASLGFSLIKWLWSRGGRLPLYIPAVKAASVAGMVMALAYAMLAGFAIPTQRSVIACIVLLLKYFLPYSFTAWQAWRYSLLLVLLLEPHAVLLPGFYLSFLAVASLLLGSQRFKFKGLKQNICLQVLCLVGLMPLTLFWFAYGAINGILANLLAIPWVGFIIVPLALISLLIVQCWPNAVVLVPVHWAVQGLLYYLNFIDTFAGVNLNFYLSNIIFVFAIMLALLLLIFFPIKALLFPSFLLLFAGFFPGSPRVKPGVAEINVLDVGQGLAIVVRTAAHTLIYDTGMQFYQGSDMAKLVIIPFLQTIGIKKLDMIVISHPDLDHRGGLASLAAHYNFDKLLVNDESFYQQSNRFNCHGYPSWQWDGVTFQFLAIRTKFSNKNNNSCVLSITNSSGRVLLVGDIEKLGETYLVKHYSKYLHSTLLLVPHHGSKTSSSPLFIQHVAPKFAVISAGFDNRYHFPHAQTLQILAHHHIQVLNTASCGMVTMTLSNHASSPSCYRSTHY